MQIYFSILQEKIDNSNRETRMARQELSTSKIKNHKILAWPPDIHKLILCERKKVQRNIVYPLQANDNSHIR